MSFASQEDFSDFLSKLKNSKEKMENFLLYYPFIKNSLIEAVEIVKEIKTISKSDPDYKAHQHSLDTVSNNLVDVYKLDKATFSTVLDYSGFSKLQIDALAEEIDSSTNTEAMTSLLLESFNENQNIINNPKSKKFFTKNNYELRQENEFSEFLDYIISDVLPMQKMENLAKLSIFQKARLEQVIMTNSEFKKIFEKFTRKDYISNNEKSFLNSIIEDEIYMMMQQVPVYSSKDGAFYATIEEQKEDFDVWKGISGRNRPDAYGIDMNKCLHVATVTSNPHYNNQNNQAIEWAHYLNNGITSKQITAANTFKILSCCAPLLDKHTNLKETLDNLRLKGDVMFEDIHILKKFPIDGEILSLFKDVSLDKYTDLKDKIEFNILGEKFNVQLKDMHEQYKESMLNLDSTLNTVEKIINERPDFDLIKTGIKQLVEVVAKAVHNGLNSPLRESSDIEELAQSITHKVSNVKKSLIKAKQDSFKILNVALEDKDEINLVKDMLNESYQDEKNIISTWTPKKISKYSKEEIKKLKTGTHNCYFDDSLSGNSKLSLVLSLNYNHGNVCEKLINDALIYQAKKISKQHSGGHKSSWNMLINSLDKINREEIPYDLKRAMKTFKKLDLGDAIMRKLLVQNHDYALEFNKEYNSLDATKKKLR